MADHVRFSRTTAWYGKPSVTDIFVDGQHVGRIRRGARAMNYTIAIRGRAEFGALSLQDAKRRVRQIYEEL